jgi:hypothetical protein
LGAAVVRRENGVLARLPILDNPSSKPLTAAGRSQVQSICQEPLMKSRIVLAALTMFSVAAAAAARADDQPIEVQVVDALNKAFGVHPGFRANHAKGIVVEGSFRALPIAQTLSKAAIFSGAAIPVTVRFSASTASRIFPTGRPGPIRTACRSSTTWPTAARPTW